MSHHERRFDPHKRHGPPSLHRLSPAAVSEQLQTAGFEVLPQNWQHEDGYLIEARLLPA